jgi:colicin import membrane protein
MLHRADVRSRGTADERTVVVDPAGPVRPARTRPGALDALLETGPGFGVAIRGYDRLQVDNYVAWAESELRTARRATDDLMSRYGELCAELELSRRLLARSPEGQELTYLSERMGSMLQMAADEAADLIAAARAEGERIVAEARADADARLRKASDIKRAAIAGGDAFREEARRLRDAAAADLRRARDEAEEIRHAADQERQEREAAETRAAAAQLAQLRTEIGELHRERTSARESLHRLSAQIDDALHALSGSRPGAAELAAAG